MDRDIGTLHGVDGLIPSNQLATWIRGSVLEGTGNRNAIGQGLRGFNTVYFPESE
jgi:hypothetical protein